MGYFSFSLISSYIFLNLMTLCILCLFLINFHNIVTFTGSKLSLFRLVWATRKSSQLQTNVSSYTAQPVSPVQLLNLSRHTEWPQPASVSPSAKLQGLSPPPQTCTLLLDLQFISLFGLKTCVSKCLSILNCF